jgi:hypothetical protein
LILNRWVKRFAALLPGPIVAAVQAWYDIFDTTLISNPEWSKTVGGLSIGAGSITVLPLVALWAGMNEVERRMYVKSSLQLFLASLVVCYIFHFVFWSVVMPSALIYNALNFLWQLSFTVFGVSLAHILSGFVLFSEKIGVGKRSRPSAT